jgi:hypothetical protein
MNLLEHMILYLCYGIGQIFAAAFCVYVAVMAICLIGVWFKMLKAKLEGREVEWNKP